jgi:hypothetical protein
LDEQVNSEFTAALLGFNGEAVVYCDGISDSVAREYAVEYARMLQNRAKRIEGQLPRIPPGLFEPNRNLIRSTLDRMWQKYFPHWSQAIVAIVSSWGTLMMDPKSTVRYLGFQALKDGSLDASKLIPVGASYDLFSGPNQIAIQECAGY